MMKRYTILAGAGISLDSPASFPVAMHIIDLLIQSISKDKNVFNTLKEGLERKNAGKKYLLSDCYIRFEMLIDIISSCDPQLQVLDAIREYKTPNLNHYNLAMLAINGHYVFTPNFDDLIERAIYKLGHIPKTICKEKDFQNFSFKEDGTIPVFKLHGCYNKYIGIGNQFENAKETIQASLSSILTNNSDLYLSAPKTNILTKCIEQSSDLLIVGYSGSDDFDIIPSLQEIETKHITWINHSNEINVHNAIRNTNIDANTGRNRLIKTKLLINSNSVSLYNTNTQKFLIDEGGIHTLPQQKNMPIKHNFEYYIKKWNSKLSDDDKFYMVGDLLYRLCFYEQAYEMFNLISQQSTYYIKAQLNSITCLDQTSKYQLALNKLEKLKQIPHIDKHKIYLSILEKEAYINYRLTPNNYKSEKLFTYVIKNADTNLSIKQCAANNYALYLRDSNRCQEALQYYQLSKDIAIQTGDLKQKCWTNSNIASLLFDKGDFIESEHICNQGYDQAEKIGDYRQLGVFENLLANIYFIKGEYDKSISLCRKSIERDRDLDNESDSSVNELLIGQCYLDMGNLLNARYHFDKSQELFNVADDQYYLYELLFYQIILALLTKNYTEASKINSKFNTTTSNQTELVYISIANKMLNNIIRSQSDSFSEELASLVNDNDNQELVSYINITYYLLLLKMPINLIGQSHIKHVRDIYRKINNTHKSTFFMTITRRKPYSKA